MISSDSQPASLPQDILQDFRHHVAEDMQLLATLHDCEPDAALIKSLKDLKFPTGLTLAPDTEWVIDATTLMHHALSTLPSEPDQKVLDDLAADYASIYLNHNISASPEESVWLDEDSLVCQQSMFQVRSWYESHGLGIPDWRMRPDDHLVYQLQFIAWLLNQDDQLETLQQLATFMDEHLLRWLGDFSERVIARCDTPYFAGIAGITASYCEALRDTLAEILEQPRPSREEVEERMLPKRPTESVPVAFTPGMGPVV